MQKKKTKQAGFFARLMKYTSSCRGKMILSVLLAVIGVIVGLAPFIAASHIVEGLFDGNDSLSYYLVWALAVGGAGMVLKRILMMSSSALSHISAFRILEQIRLKIAQKLNRVPMGYLIDTPSGQLKRIAVDNVENIETPVAHMIPEILGNLLGGLAFIVYLFVLDWRIALLALISLPLGTVCYMGMMKGYAAKWAKYTKAANEMNATVVEYVGGIEVIKAFGQSAKSYRKYSDAVMANNEATTVWQAESRWWYAGALALWPATLVFVLPVGLALCMNGLLTYSVLVSCIIVSLSLLVPIMSAMNYAHQIPEAATVLKNVDELLEIPEMQRPETAVKLTGNTIELQNVNFAYKDKNVLSGATLTIEKGKITALVGKSGSGKSTIARLIAGYWDIGGGDITIFGKNIKEIPFAQLNETISYVAQDNFLFDMTIMDNIRMGKPHATDEEVYAAAKAANCHNFIMQLEKGYLTQAGDAGGALSGGERQRITIARAILKDSPIVILDEATSYTDVESEAEIQSAIGKLAKGKTLIVIAHRLSTVVGCDKIAVVDGGKICAEGKHEQLLQNCTLYRTMWQAYEEE